MSSNQPPEAKATFDGDVSGAMRIASMHQDEVMKLRLKKHDWTNMPPEVERILNKHRNH